MILVTGATGNIGGDVWRQLAVKGHPVRILSRQPEKLGALTPGTEAVRGDLERPDTLAPAFQGADQAFLVFSAGERLPELAPPVFATAKAQGVKHVVLVSSGTIWMEPSVAIGRWHLAAEQALAQTGLHWTFLRPGNFASNTLRWAETIRSQGTVYAPAGGPSAPVDPGDIARVAVAALTQKGHEGRTYGVTGPEMMTAKEQVEIIGQELGRALRFVDVPKAGARAQMTRHGMPEVMADAVLELMDGGNLLPASQRVTRTVEDVTGRPARRFAEWVKDHRAAFQA